MKQCDRAWEVEAARDGRLSGKARALHDAHRQRCASCARETEVVEALAAALRNAVGGAPDDVSVRRLRNRVLEAADAEQIGRATAARSGSARGPRARRAGAVALGFGFALALVALASMTFRRRSSSEAALTLAPPAPVVLTAPTAPATESTLVDVAAGSDARFTRTIQPDVERFELLDGTLRLSVHRPKTGRRVVVVVPDGEIEDIGTVFDVVVSDGHTQRVGVEEGRVLVTLRDAAPATVEPGKTWQRAVRPPASATTKAPAAVAVAVAAASASASAAATAPTAAEREDAAYLHVLELLRAGSTDAARAAAARYVSDFPSGFRRAEMERVAGGAR